MDGVRDREEDPFRETKPIRQGGHEADNHRGANERPGDAFDVGAGLNLNAVATLDNAGSATAKAADLTKQFADGAASKEMAALGLNTMFQSMKATAGGSDVTLTASYPQAQWENLLRTATAVMAEELR